MAIQLTQSALAGLPDTVARPAYDRSALTAGILHVGVGNFHRAHMAWYLDRLFAQGRDHSWALIGAGVRPGDVVVSVSGWQGWWSGRATRPRGSRSCRGR